MGNPNGDDPRDEFEDNDGENPLTMMQQQKEHDLIIEMAKQGASPEDFPDGVPEGAFIDENKY